MEAWALWRRLDAPGHDACRLDSTGDGWELHGTAVFRHEAGPALLTYVLRCDRGWRTREGRVRGWLGGRAVEFAVARTAHGVWTVDGTVIAGLERCLDLDLGFTPATNLAQLRRAALEVGQALDLPVAWMDVPGGTLEVLPQRYERRAELAYWYEAPTVPYAGLLEVTPEGFARRYPGLWEMEP